MKINFRGYKGKSRESVEKIHVVVLLRDETGQGHSAGNGGGEKWSGSGRVWREEPRVFLGIFHVGCERK